MHKPSITALSASTDARASSRYLPAIHVQANCTQMTADLASMFIVSELKRVNVFYVAKIWY
jgi:hypothetical protein